VTWITNLRHEASRPAHLLLPCFQIRLAGLVAILLVVPLLITLLLTMLSSFVTFKERGETVASLHLTLLLDDPHILEADDAHCKTLVGAKGDTARLGEVRRPNSQSLYSSAARKIRPAGLLVANLLDTPSFYCESSSAPSVRRPLI
jgi:hypothetical protein